MSSDFVTPPQPRFRINDLHHPDLLPLLSIPQFPPPPRDSIIDEEDGRKDCASGDVPEPSALDAVIALLKKTDVSYLRPRQPPVASPPDPTPLLRAVAAKSRGVFIAKQQGVSPPQRQVPTKSPPPIEGVQRPSSLSPNASSDHAAKRRRTSELRLELATSIETHSKPAPTVAQEAATAAKSFLSAVEDFSRHADEVSSIRSLLAATLKLPASIDINLLGGDPRKFSPCFDSLRAIVDRGKVVLDNSELESESESGLDSVGAALEASAVILHLAATSGLHLAVPEEGIESAIEAARFHLQHNYLAVSKLDERHDEIANRIQALLDVTARLVASTKTPTALCLPPLRPCMLVLTSPHAPAGLQDKAGMLLAAVFGAHSELRGSLIRDFVQLVVLSTPCGKSARRDVPIFNADIHVVSATFLTMIASTVEFPQEKSTNFDVNESVREAYAQAVAVADRFWSLILEKMGEAKSMKSEMEVDIVAITQFILIDLLAAAIGGTDYPAAGMVIQRLVAALLISRSSSEATSYRAMDNAEAAVKSAYVDLLGRILAAHAANESNLQTGPASDRSDARQAVLERLSWGGGGSLAASWARRFLLMADLVEGLQPPIGPSTPSSPEDTATALMAARRMEEALSTRDMFRGSANSDESLQTHLKVLARGILNDVAPPIVSWLVNEGLDPRTQAPTVRSKCVRALSEVVVTCTGSGACDGGGGALVTDGKDAASPLQGHENHLTLAVLTAARRCLTDDSISVREAALALCGRAAVSGQQESLATLSEILLPALEDRGASVRKSAVKMLQDVMSRCGDDESPAFSAAAYASAARALMPLAHDVEESVKAAVARAFASTWFTPCLSKKEMDANSKHQRLKRARRDETKFVSGGVDKAARRLAIVAASCCGVTSENGAVAMPISDPNHPLIASLRLAAGGGDQHSGCHQTLAAALLEGAFTVMSGTTGDEDDGAENQDQDQDQDQDRKLQREGYLLGLHALTMAVPTCLDGNGDRILANLGPRVGGGVLMEEEDAGQRRRLLCMLSILEAHFMANGRSKATETRREAERQVASDLVALINGHRYTQVVAAACKCLGKAASSCPHATGPLLVHVTNLHHSWLLQRHTSFNSIADDTSTTGSSNATVQNDVRLIPRFLFILGHLCRHGAEVLGLKGLQECMQLFCIYFNAVNAEKGKEVDVRIRRCALEAVGNVAAAKPTLLVSSGPKAVLESSLLPDAPQALKITALATLTEVLQADAQAGDALVVQPTTPESGGFTNSNGVTSDSVDSSALTGNKGGRKKKKVLLARDTEAKLNLEPGKDSDDAGGVGGGVLQLYWEAILRLADDQNDVAIRRRVVALMEVVLREGLVGPWTAVPCLVGLSADPVAADVASKSQKLLVRLAQRYPQYVNAANIIAGIQRCLSDAVKEHGGSNLQRRAQSRALGALYGILPWPSRPRRNEFLRLLVRRLLGAAVKEELSQGGGEKCTPQPTTQRQQALPSASLGGAVIVCLPLRRTEEVNIILTEATSLCMRHADRVQPSYPNKEGARNDEVDAKEDCEAMRVLLLVCRFMKRAYGVDGRRAASAVGNGAAGAAGASAVPSGTKKGNEEGAVLPAVDQKVMDQTLHAIFGGSGSQEEEVGAMLEDIVA